MQVKGLKMQNDFSEADMHSLIAHNTKCNTRVKFNDCKHIISASLTVTHNVIA